MTSYDITLVRGDDHTFAVEWTDSEGEPVEIDTARMHIRKVVSSGSTLLELTVGEGLTVTDNRVDVELSAEQTAELTSGVYDLEIVSAASGDVKTLVGGRVRVREDVTR
jgi:hypothetical protein